MRGVDRHEEHAALDRLVPARDGEQIRALRYTRRQAHDDLLGRGTNDGHPLGLTEHHGPTSEVLAAQRHGVLLVIDVRAQHEQLPVPEMPVIVLAVVVLVFPVSIRDGRQAHHEHCRKGRRSLRKLHAPLPGNR
jgi:hypothetical protein